MKRRLYIFSIIIFLIPNVIKALECDSSDKERLISLANNITYVVEDYEDKGNTYFKVTFSGLSKELRIFEPDKFLYYYNLSESYFGDTSVEKLIQGKQYVYEVYGINACYFDKVRRITIDIPKINPYYNDALCDNAKEYKYCQKWYQHDLSYEEFVNNIEKYLDEKKIINNSNNDIESDYDNTFIFDYEKFYKRVYFPSLIITIFLIIVLIVFWRKERKKNKLY